VSSTGRIAFTTNRHGGEPGRNFEIYAVNVGPCEGGEYRIVLSYVDAHQSATGKTTRSADVVRGRFLELVPDRKIVQSVQFESADPRFAGEMKLTWQLNRHPKAPLS
jgi:hypothetical protein